MNLLQWSIEPLQLPLRYVWKISRNASTEKTNLIVTVRHGNTVSRGEAAPNIRYGESPESILKQFRSFVETAPPYFEDATALRDHCDRVQAAWSLRFAIESAWYHLQANNRRSDFQELFKLRFRNAAPTSYTIPIMEPGVVREFYENERLSRFPLIKLKVNHELAEDLTRELARFCKQPILVDANESFTDVEACIRFLEKIRKLPVEIIEQPLPSAMIEESVYLKRYCPFPLFADEAITHDPDFETIEKCFDGINMKLMKAGGYDQGLRILREAKKRGMRTMIGCMVETTLGISSALNLSALADYIDLDSFLLLDEEPYRMVDERNGVLHFTDAEKLS